MEKSAKETISTPPQTTRSERLKEIDALYRTQLKQVYNDSKYKQTISQDTQPHENKEIHQRKVATQVKKMEVRPLPTSVINPITTINPLQRVRSSQSLLITKSIESSKLLGRQGDSRASIFLQGSSSKTIEILRRENETKELKIRELTSKCQGLIDKLQQFVPAQQLQIQLENLRNTSSDRSESLQRLFKIKTEEIFFKVKLQVVGLLQEFGVSREQLSDSNEIKSETELFMFLSRKLKDRLKDFRSQQAESNFSLQKDRIVNQKQQERIHFLTETNELLRLNENKLKHKIEDLKGQLNEYIDRLRARQHDIEERESEIFRLRRQNQQLQAANQKLTTTIRGVQNERSQERRGWQARERELKQLLTNYNVEKQKIQAIIEEQQETIEEQQIRMRFLEQEIERINRELVRWKERLEGLEREKNNKIKEIEDEKNSIFIAFQDYRLTHNEGSNLEARSEVQEAMKRVQQYQLGYQQALDQLEQERRLLQRAEEQSEERAVALEKEWLAHVKKLERAKQDELAELVRESETKQSQLQEQFHQKELLLVEELQAILKAQSAEKDKSNTEKLIQKQSQNDELKRQIVNLNKMLEVKDSLISALNGKKLAFE